MVKNEVLKFFSSRMSTMDNFRIRLDNIPLQKIYDAENNMLIAPLRK